MSESHPVSLTSHSHGERQAVGHAAPPRAAPPTPPPDRYARLIEPHRSTLGRAAYRLTADHAEAEDLVQETLLRAYTRLHLLQSESGDAVGGWLYTIQLNLFRERYRQSDVLARRPALVSLDGRWFPWTKDGCARSAEARWN